MKFLQEKLYHSYHGSKNDFDLFDYDKIGQNGSEHGYGFYFTNREDIANSYGDYIIEADVEITNPLSDDEITINLEDLKKYIREYIDPVGNDYLSAYGDVNQLGYEKLLEIGAHSIMTWAQSDVTIISELFYLKDKITQRDLDGIKEVFGRDGIVYSGYDTSLGRPVENYIVFSNDQIKNKHKIKYTV